MRKSSWVVLGLICVIAGVLVYMRMVSGPQPSDEEQIHLLLAKGQSAIERKDLKDALSCISRDYSDDAGFTFESLRLQGVQAFRAEGKYDVTLENTLIHVRGHAADVETQAVVSLVLDGSVHRIFSGKITITLRKEETNRWLVIPVRSWKVTSIYGLPGELKE